MSTKMTPALWSQLQFFTAAEFERPEQMEWDLMRRLDKARAMAAVPFRINRKAVRTAAENAAIPNAAGNSAHLRGFAVDLEPATSHERFRVLFGLVTAGFTRIGDKYADGHIHADCDPSLPVQVSW